MNKLLKVMAVAVSVLALLTGCGQQKKDTGNTDTAGNKAIWECSESETRTYTVLINEHSDELRKSADEWLTDGKLDPSKYSTESGETYRVQMLMPENVAKNLDTAELLDFCLQHSSVKDFTLFNSWEDGFANVVNVVNAFDYVFARKDMASAVYDAYMAREVVKEDVKAQGIDSVLEIILAQDATYDGLTDEQRQAVITKKDEFKKCREENNIRIYDSSSMFGAALNSNSKWDSMLKK